MGLELVVVPGDLAVCRLSPGASVPSWLEDVSWQSVTRTSDELSIVCSTDSVPDGVSARGPFVAFRVRGVLEFSLVGVLESVLTPLADAAIAVFVVSTHDTDYVLVAKDQLVAASNALIQAGHTVDRSGKAQ